MGILDGIVEWIAKQVMHGLDRLPFSPWFLESIIFRC